MSGSWARVTSLLVGLWLLVSGFVMDSSSSQTTNAWMSGAAAVVLSGIALARPRVRFGNMALGVWLFLSAFMFPGSGEMIWSLAASGILLFALSLVPEREQHTGPFSHHRRLPA